LFSSFSLSSFFRIPSLSLSSPCLFRNIHFPLVSHLLFSLL
jgi:hypothetical protein